MDCSLSLESISDKCDDVDFGVLKKSALNARSLSEFLKENKEKRVEKKEFTDFYAAIRGLKELSLIEAWFKIKGGFDATTDKKKRRKLHQIYLLPHVIFGHLFSPHYGESATIPQLKTLFVSRYFQKNDLGWRTNDSTRMDPSFIGFFINEMVKTFNAVLDDDDLLKQVTVTHGGGAFNVIIPAIVNRTSFLKISPLLSRAYVGKLELNDDIPIKDEQVLKKKLDIKMQNFPLKSITIMVDEKSLNSVDAFYAKKESGSSGEISLEYLSGIFSISQCFFTKVVHFLADEVVDGLQIVNDSHQKEKKDKTLAAELAATTLWPEFACFKESEIVTDQQLSEKKLSDEAQQVLKTVQELDYLQDAKQIIASLKKAATEKQEEGTKTSTISQKSAAEFVQWFLKEEKFGLLQQPAFADAFGFLWEQVNTKDLGEKPLEDYIKEWQPKMLSSAEALTRLGAKLGLSLAIPAEKPLQISQKKKDDGSSGKAPLIGFVNALNGNVEKVEGWLESKKIISVDVPGDGECGYHALDPDYDRSQKDKTKDKEAGRGSRYHIADTLIKAVDKEDIRKLIAPEILGYLEATIARNVTCRETCREECDKHTIDGCEHLQKQISEKVKKDRSAVLGENIGETYLQLDLDRRKVEKDLQTAVNVLRAIIEKSLTVEDVLSLENGHPKWQEQYKEELDTLKEERTAEKLNEFLIKIKTGKHEISKDDILNKLLLKHKEWKDLGEFKTLQTNIEADEKRAWLQPLQSEGIVKQYLTNVIKNGNEQLVCSQNAGSTGIADAFAFISGKNLIVVNEGKGEIMHKSDFKKEETIFIFMIPGGGFNSVGHFKKGKLESSPDK
jgi:hypothetical protein